MNKQIFTYVRSSHDHRSEMWHSTLQVQVPRKLEDDVLRKDEKQCDILKSRDMASAHCSSASGEIRASRIIQHKE
jgi:hypothetical protein